MKSSLSQEKSLKAVKTEALGSGVLYPRDPDGESRLKTGHQLFFNLTESVRQNSAEESEKGESRITCGKTAPATSTAQVEELPHRYPARDLKHISQAWKDSPLLATRPLKMDEQQGTRWNAGESKEGKKKKKEIAKKLQTLCTKLSPELSACMQPHRLED